MSVLGVPVVLVAVTLGILLANTVGARAKADPWLSIAAGPLLPNVIAEGAGAGGTSGI